MTSCRQLRQFMFKASCVAHNHYSQNLWIKSKNYYTGFWASADFSGAFFTHVHYQKNSLSIQLMQFSLHKWRNSFTHAFCCGFGSHGSLQDLKTCTSQGLGILLFLTYSASIFWIKKRKKTLIFGLVNIV